MSNRKQIRKAFKSARKNLWDGRDGDSERHTFICTAIDGDLPGAQRACDIIMRRLDPYTNMYNWLSPKINERPTSEQIQAHRRAWLELLIREFK